MENKFKFTKTKIDRLTYELCSTLCSSGNVTLWDTELPGARFGLYITPKNVKTYFSMGRMPNKRTVRTVIGRAEIYTPEQAREIARQHQLDYAKGVSPKHKRLTITALTLQRIAEEYIATRQRGKSKSRLKDSSAQLYRMQLQHLSDWLDLPLVEITKPMIVARHEKIAQKYSSPDAKGRMMVRGGPGSADGVMKFLNAVYEYAMDVYEEDIPKNPVGVLGKVGAWYNLPPRQGYIKPTDLKAFWTGLQEIRSQVARDYYTVLLFTGARADETAMLKPTDVDLDEGTAIFRETKTGSPFLVPVPGTVLEILRRRIALGGDYVFQTKPGVYYSSNGAGASKSLKAKGITVTPHYFRRGYKTYLKNCGVDELTRKRLMNHAMPSARDMNEWYTVHELDELRLAVDKLERYILRFIEGESRVIPLRVAGG